MTISVRNLPPTCTEVEVIELFGKYGKIQDLQLSSSKTSALVRLSEGEDQAIQELDQIEWKGQLLQVASTRGDDPP